MTQNSLGLLSSYLFDQMERLNESELDPSQLEHEVERSKAMMNIANSVVNTGKLALEARKYMDDRMDAEATLPPLLQGEF